MPEAFKTVRILGIDFYNDTFAAAIEWTHVSGGLILAPSGPGLADLGRNPHYDRALEMADLNLIDSGYLALLWKQSTGQDLARHSGLKFIKALTEDSRFKSNSNQLWVLPEASHIQSTKRYLDGIGVRTEAHNYYEAPYYQSQPVTDDVLLERVRSSRPQYIILCVAGGKQEVLGHWLRDQLDYRPAIICIGAAIAFLSGQQARIPPWADRIFIGWMLRILRNPGTFLPRYWKARKLSHLVRRYGAGKPVKSGAASSGGNQIA
ncbi:WecB/TagA/CpsF family glycosyltransferase [Coraliomargarita parva]|uniref:WecB/TagA/CpsF family glycosyltransferase n=1 Tax=Coraliomargarita parva TaxID=3014050 RepID=UPI0022B52813|nr:WecB/TagA/CpsF family glycosyltransferase [Coraliomargarita parva]